MKTLDDYRGIHEGHDFVIMGTGPSLHFLNKNILKDKIVICVGGSILKHKTPDYYVSSDGGVCCHSHWQYVKEGNFPLIFGQAGVSPWLQKYGGGQEAIKDRICFYNKEKLIPPVMNKNAKKLIFGYSSLHCAVHFAVICGAAKIIIIGGDCRYYGKIARFYDYAGEEKDTWTGPIIPGLNVIPGQPIGAYSGPRTRVARAGDADGYLGAIITYWRQIKTANPKLCIYAIGGLLETVFPKYRG